MAEVFLTARFALNPTRAKRAVLDRVLDTYRSALSDLMRRATADDLLPEVLAPVEVLRGERAGSLRPPSAREIVARLRARFGLMGEDLSGALRDSLLNVAAMMLASHAGLRVAEEAAGLPRMAALAELEREREAALAALASSTTLDAEREAAARMERAFRARDTAFCLVQRTREIDVRETARGRFHVVLPLLARRKGRRQVPLALFCDRWQEEMFLRHPNAAPRRAVLLRRGSQYMLHVVFAFQVPDPPDRVAHVLGVYPGLDGRIGLCLIPVAGGREEAWAVEQQNRLEVLRRVGRELRMRQRHGSTRIRFRRREVLAEIAMLAVRQIVDAAAEHGARLVLPDLTGMQQRLRDRTVRALVGSWNYRMILSAVRYKAALRGLAKPLTLRSGAYAARECPGCGAGGAGNPLDGAGWQAWLEAQKRGKFLCPICGLEEHSAVAAARIVARRALERERLMDNAVA